MISEEDYKMMFGENSKITVKGDAIITVVKTNEEKITIDASHNCKGHCNGPSFGCGCPREKV